MKGSAESDFPRAGAIWMRDLDQPPLAVTPLIPAAFRRVGLESAAALAAAQGAATLEAVRQRLETGRRCYTAWVGGELAAYGWVSFDFEFVGELRLRLRL